MALMGIDIAWARPTDAQIVSTGAHFVARYLSPDKTKNITSSEVQSYPRDGLSVVVVWEWTANRMLAGFAAGVADAQSAEAQRRAAGLPDDMPIYFACDFDAVGSQYSTINQYMRGVNSVIGLARTGFYGGYYTVENVAAAPATASFFWQASAWSNGHWSGHANIRQDGGTLLGGSADVDHAETTDFGQYPRPTAAVTITKEAVDLTDEQNSILWGLKNTVEGMSNVVAQIQAQVNTLPDLQKAVLQAVASSKLTSADIQAALANGTLKVQVSVSAN